MEIFYHVTTATLDQPEHGLNTGLLAQTDVLTWWGHVLHNERKEPVLRAITDFLDSI